MEPKDFFEVFPTLVLKEKAAGYMTGTTVLRVSSTKNRHLLKIYIKSTHIIPKSIILEVQKEIEKQLFGESEIEVRIYERFELSDSYSITTVFGSYRESMEKELSESSLTLYDAFHNSRLSFSENNTVNIQIPDRFLYREKQRELEDYIEKVITDRFSMGLILNIDYYELPEGELSKENELMEIVKLMGSDVLPDDQKILIETARVIRVGFLQQNAFHKDDTYVDLDKQYRMMKIILLLFDKANAAAGRGIGVADIKATGWFEKLIKMKYDIPNDKPQMFEEYQAQLAAELDGLEAHELEP